MTNPNGWREDVVPRFEWRMLLHRLRIEEGSEIAPGYGIAYYEPGRPVAVLMPLPFNVIVCWWRALMWHVRCPPGRMVEWAAGRREERAYLAGYNDGVLTRQPNLRSR